MLLFVVLLQAVATAVQGSACTGGCNVPLKVYEEFGCEPVFAKPGDCCPSHYNCAKFEGRSADKCYVQGKVFNEEESIDADLTMPNCLAACKCRKDQPQGVLCAHVECPEYIGGPPLKPGCFRAYKLKDCCSFKEVCPPFDSLAKCEYDGKTYHEGERWYSEDDELKCVCKKGFEGKLEAPFCAKVKCGLELLNPKDFKNKCAPIYFGNKGCPIQWECPKDGDTIKPSGTKSDLKCYYGDKELNIGDKLILNISKHSPKVNCECKIPPMVTCIQDASL